MISRRAILRGAVGLAGASMFASADALAASGTKVVAVGDLVGASAHSGVQAQVAARFANPTVAACLVTSDNIQSGHRPSDYDNYMLDSYLAHGAAQWVWPTTGHHDWGISGVANLTGTLTSPAMGLGPHLEAEQRGLTYGKGLWYFAHDLPGWRIIHLSGTTNAGSHKIPAGDGLCVSSRPGKPQYNWLKQQLADARAQSRSVLAIWSDPRWGTPDTHHRGEPLVGPFWDLLGASHPHNALVLNGHKHNYERFDYMSPSGLVDRVRGIPQITIGTGGNSHYAFTGAVAKGSLFRDAVHFGVLDLTLGVGWVKTQFVPSGHSPIDVTTYSMVTPR